MKQLISKVRPTSGFSHFVHIFFTLILPFVVFVLIRIDLVALAIGMIFLSKWRMLAVQPRHWLAHIRANSVDIIVGMSVVIFMASSFDVTWQLMWVAAYSAWLLLIKPSSSTSGVSLQAFIALVLGIMAVYTSASQSVIFSGSGASRAELLIATWVVSFVAARHFFTAFNEAYGRFLSHAWAFFAAAAAWVLSHWLLYYGIVSQPALLLTVLGFGLATLYYLDKTDQLSKFVRRNIVFVMTAIVIIVLVLSDWSDKTIR